MANKIVKKRNQSPCIDCYGNEPWVQNEGLKSYYNMMNNSSNCENSNPCKSCEECYDPYLKKVFTEGCLTGEGTECNPLSIDLDCIPSGGVSNCTVITPDCCDYILENIVFGQVCISFTENNYVFGIETQFIISINRVGGGADGFAVLMEGSYTKQELIDFVYSSWQFSVDITTIEKTESGVCITVTKPTSNQLGCSLALPEGISDCSVYDVSGTYSLQSQTCEGIFDLSAIFGTKFQVNINDSWTDLTENALEGTWESICDTRDITSYRILDETNNVLYSGNLEPQDCRGGGEEITKSICEWIDYLYNQSSSGSENIYTSDGTLTDDRILDGDGKNLNFVNVRSFSVQADPQENDSYGLAFGNYTEAGVKAYTGVIIGGLGKNNGTYISGQSQGQDGENTAGVYISGINTNSEARDIILNPQNGKIQITNLLDDNSAPKVVGQDSNGNLCLVDPSGSSIVENIYTTNGELEEDRTVTGAGYFLKFEDLSSFLAQSQFSKMWLDLEEIPGFFNGIYSGTGNILLESENWSTGIEPAIKIYAKESKGSGPAGQLHFSQHEGPSEALDINVFQYNSGTGYPRLGGGVKMTSRGDAYGLKLVLTTNTNTGNDAVANDLDIEFVTGRATLRNLPTDNTATQVAGKDSNGRLAWRDVSSIASSLPSNLCKMIGIDYTATAITGASTDHIFGSVLIPANTITGNSLLEIETVIKIVSPSVAATHRLFINTAVSITGANQLALLAGAGSFTYSKLERTFWLTATNINGYQSNLSATIDDTAASATVTTHAVDWTVDQYILCVANNGTGTTTHQFTSVELKKV